jgi:hypothetical protein
LNQQHTIKTVIAHDESFLERERERERERQREREIFKQKLE